MAALHWTCPYCDRDTTLTDTFSTNYFSLLINNNDGLRAFHTLLIVCPNPHCRKFTLTIQMYELTRLANGATSEGTVVLQTWKLIPPSSAKVFPEYVPKPIRDDYVEACLIRELSPKASATLSRRCLQGMIRDFWAIQKTRLIDEVDALKDKTDALTWAAIDAVRKVGNIGAHMEKDINVIVDVEANEAQLLIGLIEVLVKDWYVNRHEREERLRDIAALSAKKDAAKSAPSVI
jgi:hypothetical protein